MYGQRITSLAKTWGKKKHLEDNFFQTYAKPKAYFFRQCFENKLLIEVIEH